MNIRASGRAALILAAALGTCIIGPMRATESAARTSDSTEKTAAAAAKPVVLNKFIKHRHVRKSASKTRKSARFAAKARKAVPASVADQNDIEPAIPASVANANAQLALADMPAETAQADAETPARSDAMLQFVSADQLNDVDRAIGETAALPDAASPDIVATKNGSQMAAGTDGTTLDRTSLIGKIFIAFGGLLTLASAARMFFA